MLLQRPLIDAEFEAWPAGPVEVNLQHQYPQYGWTKMPQQAIQPIKFDDADVADLLAAVWETYQDQSGNELEILARTELPWLQARTGLADDEPSHRLISNADMQRYYLSIYSGD